VSLRQTIFFGQDEQDVSGWLSPMSAIPVDAYGDDYGGRFGLLTSSIVIVAVIVNRTPSAASIAVDNQSTGP
jgi:hypothetical protein